MKLDDAPILERLDTLHTMCHQAADDIKIKFMPMQKYLGCGKIYVTKLGDKVRISVDFPDNDIFYSLAIRFDVDFQLSFPEAITVQWRRVVDDPYMKKTISRPTVETLLEAYYSLVELHVQKVFQAAVTKDHLQLVQLLR